MILELLIGLKTQALFDIWSVEHVLSGISAGHAVRKTNHRMFKKKLNLDAHSVQTRYFDVIWVLLVAYMWETIEHYMETGMLWSWVEYWFQGIEFWGNRIIADPLMLVVGYLIAKKHPKLVIPARVLSVIWLFSHVFLFPHSMYLQETLVRYFW